jgi:choline transport protein
VLSLPNGGTAGTVWIFLVSCFGMFFVTLSMAEMVSLEKGHMHSKLR